MRRGIGVSQATYIGMKIVRSENKLLRLPCYFMRGDLGDASYRSNYWIIGRIYNLKQVLTLARISRSSSEHPVICFCFRMHAVYSHVHNRPSFRFRHSPIGLPLSSDNPPHSRLTNSPLPACHICDAATNTPP